MIAAYWRTNTSSCCSKAVYQSNVHRQRPPDLTQLGFFFCGYLKHTIYKKRPSTDIQRLKITFRDFDTNIKPHFTGNAVKDVSRITVVIQSTRNDILTYTVINCIKVSILWCLSSYLISSLFNLIVT